MYYNRTLTTEFAQLLEEEGKLRWLFEYIKNRTDLDFLIGRNNNHQWISVYRGLSRIFTIRNPIKGDKKTLDAAEAYRKLVPSLFEKNPLKDNFESEIEALISKINELPKFDRYYKNKKEGFYQNELSRRYGICGNASDKFVIVDKEAVIGYENNSEKEKLYGPVHAKYKKLQRFISEQNPVRYGKNISKKAIGNELDFLAIDKEGNILLIEYKHGTNTSGIYLSSLQIGMYYDIFTSFPRHQLINSIEEMLEQRKSIGLIHSDWKMPEIKDIIPVLIISEFNYKYSSAQKKFSEVMQLLREQTDKHFLSNLKTYNFTMEKGLKQW